MPFRAFVTTPFSTRSTITSEMTPLWTPSPARAAGTHLTAFARAAAAAAGRPLDDYWALHAWSVAEPDAFWQTCLRESGLPYRGAAGAPAHDDAPMPDTRWFAGVTVNYAEALLAGRGAAEDAPAIIATNEAAEDRVISRAGLRLARFPDALPPAPPLPHGDINQRIAV